MILYTIDQIDKNTRRGIISITDQNYTQSKTIQDTSNNTIITITTMNWIILAHVLNIMNVNTKFTTCHYMLQGQSA